MQIAAEYVQGSFPDRVLMSTGQQFDRVGRIAVPGDLAVMGPIKTDDLGQYVGVACVGFGAGRGMPLPIPSSRERVDREHQVSSRIQGHYPRAAVSSITTTTCSAGRSTHTAGACSAISACSFAMPSTPSGSRA